MPRAARGDPAPPPPPPAGGLITIRWWRLPEPFESEFDWGYRPLPQIPDELGKRLLGEVADRLSPAQLASPRPATEAGDAGGGPARPAELPENGE